MGEGKEVDVPMTTLFGPTPPPFPMNLMTYPSPISGTMLLLPPLLYLLDVLMGGKDIPLGRMP